MPRYVPLVSLFRDTNSPLFLQIRRESTNLDDFFHGHIGGMDCYARGLRIAAKMIEDGVIDGMIDERYSTFDSPLGQKLRNGQGTLEEFTAHAHAQGEPKCISGQQELYENIFMEYMTHIK